MTPPFPRALAAIVPLLVAPAARAGQLELESVAQLRHDHFGEQYLPAWQLMRFDQDAGAVQLAGYAGLEWLAGVPAPLDADVYHLNAAGSLGGGAWVVGRQRGMGALRAQTFDGLRYGQAMGEHLHAEAWVGLARHQDIDDLMEFGSIGRVQLSWLDGPLAARAGFEMAEGPDTEMIARQDLEARVRLGNGTRPGRLGLRGVVAEPLQTDDPTTLEWGRAELAVRPWSPLELSVHAQQREAADPSSMFGDAIIDALAGGAVREAGAGARLIGPRWSAFSSRCALVNYGEAQWGYKADLAWQPGRGEGSVRVLPAVSSRVGPGGQFHAVSSTLRWQAADSTAFDANLAVVPYEREEVWDMLVTAGLRLQVQALRWATLGAMVDAATDGGALMDVRGGATLNLRWSS